MTAEEIRSHIAALAENVMRETFPYYERDDKDDYLYIVHGEDVLKAASRIAAQLAELNERERAKE